MEVRLSHNKPHGDIRRNSLSKAPDRQYAFDDSVNCNASGTVKMISLYLWICRICSGNLSHNRSMQFSTLATVQFSVCIPVLLRLNCTSSDTKHFDYWSISLYTALNKPASDIVFSILWKEKICVNHGRSKWQNSTKCKPIKRCASMATCYWHLYVLSADHQIASRLTCW